MKRSQKVLSLFKIFMKSNSDILPCISQNDPRFTALLLGFMLVVHMRFDYTYGKRKAAVKVRQYFLPTNFNLQGF